MSLYGTPLSAFTANLDQMTAGQLPPVIVNGVAAIIGPIVAALAMDDDPSRLFVSLAAVQAVLAAYLAVRIVVRAPKPVEAQSRFAPLADRVTAFVLQRRPGGTNTPEADR